MKKVLAIVISLIMVFSLASAAFAYEIAPGQVYFGPVSNAYANPGETTQLTVNFSADAFENDGYPTDGILHIPVPRRYRNTAATAGRSTHGTV